MPDATPRRARRRRSARTPHLLLAALTSLLALAGAAHADGGVIEVPKDAPSIKAALAIAPVGGTILIDDGIWSGPSNLDIVEFGFKAVLIASKNGPASCVIDGTGQLNFLRLITQNPVEVRGLTMTRCHIAIDVVGAHAVIRDCVFIDNHETTISLGGSGVDARNHATVAIERCLFVGNFAPTGGAVRFKESICSVDSCTFLDNGAITGGSLQAQKGAVVTLRNSIFRGGHANNGDEFSISAIDTVVTVDHCDIAGGLAGVQLLAGTLNWDESNIDADPLFADAAAGDLHLMPGSPCINTGSPDSPLDADGSPADMGALPYAPWADLGGGVPGAMGLPLLVADGPLIGDLAVTLTLSSVRAGTPVTLFFGVQPAGVPTKGGVFWPVPLLTLAAIPVPDSGVLVLDGRWPLGLPSAFSIYAQVWFADPLAADGVAASNGVRGITP